MATNKIEQLQLLQQNLQNLTLQKQQIQSNLMELESALTELKTASKVYKIVGKIMISSNSEALTQDLKEKKEILDIRLKNFLQQEGRLKKEMELTQSEVMNDLGKNKKK